MYDVLGVIKWLSLPVHAQYCTLILQRAFEIVSAFYSFRLIYHIIEKKIMAS
jgi:hypothetical protein